MGNGRLGKLDLLQDARFAIRPYGRFVEKRDAVPVCDKRFNDVDACDFSGSGEAVKGKVARCQRVLEHRARSRSILPYNKMLAEQIFKRSGRFGKIASGRAHRNELLRAKDAPIVFPLVEESLHKRTIQASFVKHRKQVLRARSNDSHLQIGTLQQESGKRAGYHVFACGHRNAEAKRSASARQRSDALLDQPLVVHHDRKRVAQHLARLGQRKPTVAIIEQLCPVGAFKMGNVLRNGGLRNIEYKHLGCEYQNKWFSV